MIPPPDPVLERMSPEHRDTEHLVSFLQQEKLVVGGAGRGLTSSNNMAVGPRNNTMVRSRGNNPANTSPELLSPIISARLYFSRSSALPNWWTNTGDIMVMKPADTNLLLMVSG